MDTKEKPEDDDDFDPHLHRVLSHPNTSPETLLHIVKAILGTGILAGPDAFKYSGFTVGIISTTLIGAFNTYCVHILITAQYILCKKTKRPFLTYPESMEVGASMGPQCLRCLTNYAAIITNVFLMLFLVGTCCIYILFVGENMRDVINFYFGTHFSIHVVMIMCFIPFLVFSFVKNLKVFAAFSLIGNIICVFTFGIIIYYVSHNLTPMRELKQVGAPLDYPLFFGISVFSLQSITITVVAESNMASPKDFLKPFGVWNIGMTFITALYIFISMMGYWRYGKDTKASITLNLPIDSIVGQSVRILYSLSLVLTYGLNIYVWLKVFWDCFMESRYGESSERKKFILDYTLRIIMVVISYVLSLSVPFLSIVISFVGCAFLSCLVHIFPAFLEVCARWPDDLGTLKWRLWKDIVVIMFALVIFASGCYSSIAEIVRRFQENGYNLMYSSLKYF